MPEATDSSLATRREPEALATIGATMDPVLERMMSLAHDPASMKDVLEMYRALQKDKARVLFQEAMTTFREICPPIPRRTENTQFKVTRNGRTENRKYSTLEDIAFTIRKPLADTGLSFRWGDVTIAGGMMTMPCIISHVGGHSESSAVIMPVESRAGCSEQQKYGSAGTYAQRASLIQALGLTTCDEDADGAEPGDTGPTINESQAADLDTLIADVGADRAKFLAWVGIKSPADLPASRFQEAIKALESKRKGNK